MLGTKPEGQQKGRLEEEGATRGIRAPFAIAECALSSKGANVNDPSRYLGKLVCSGVRYARLPSRAMQGQEVARRVLLRKGALALTCAGGTGRKIEAEVAAGGQKRRSTRRKGQRGRKPAAETEMRKLTSLLVSGMGASV